MSTTTSTTETCCCGAPTTTIYGDCADCDAAAEAQFEASAEGELRGEFAMNWVMGGGDPADIGAAYTQWRHS